MLVLQYLESRLDVLEKAAQILGVALFALH